MIDHILRFTFPGAYAVLPSPLESPEASALLLAIGLQESGFLVRRQANGGPALGFWQFERGGIKAVMRHPTSAAPLEAALHALRFVDGLSPTDCWMLVEQNDIVAAIFARLLIATLPDALPRRDTPRLAWKEYLDGWRPGKPHAETWESHYAEAWDRVDALRPPPGLLHAPVLS